MALGCFGFRVSWLKWFRGLKVHGFRDLGFIEGAMLRAWDRWKHSKHLIQMKN